MIVRSIAGGVEVLAPAKFNLFLEVLRARPDGYHEIESLMVTVNLYDTLTVTELDSGAIVLQCDDRACRPEARTWLSGRPSGSRLRPAVLAVHGSASTRRFRRRRVWLAVRATRPRPWRHSTGSGTWGCPRTGWTRSRGRLAATWLSSCTHRRRSAGGGASASRVVTIRQTPALRAGRPDDRPEHGRRLPQPETARDASADRTGPWRAGP